MISNFDVIIRKIQTISQAQDLVAAKSFRCDALVNEKLYNAAPRW
jgi:hypothetical protein